MNKDVCARCYQENILNRRRKEKYWSIRTFVKAWDDGTVICPHHVAFPEAKTVGTWTVYKGEAWKQCPRKLEHAIADGLDHVK